MTVGDNVVIRPAETDRLPYIARIEKIEAGNLSVVDSVMVKLRWYYRPEDTVIGGKSSHGSKELFWFDHFSVQSADTIEAKCNVHSFKRYRKLESAGENDFFSRIKYKGSTRNFTPTRVPV